MQYILLAAQDGAEFDERGDRLRKERGEEWTGGAIWETKQEKETRRKYSSDI